MGSITDRTIHVRSKSIDLDLRLASPLPAQAWRGLQDEVRVHRTGPVPGSLGPIEIDAQGRALRLRFPSFDLRTTRLDSVLDRVRPHPLLVSGILARAQILGRRLVEAGRSPDVGDPAALMIHPLGQVAVLGIGLPGLRSLLVPSAPSESNLEAQLRRLAASLGAAEPLAPAPKAEAFGQAWREAVENAGLRGPEVLRGPLGPPRPPASIGGPSGAGSSLTLALPDRPASRRPPPAGRRPPAKAETASPRPTDRAPAAFSKTESDGLLGPELAALAAASPEAQMAALRASERPLRVPPQGVWIGLAALLFGIAFAILFQTHQSVRPEARELAPPVARPLRGPGFEPKPPSAIGRPPGAIPPAGPSDSETQDVVDTQPGLTSQADLISIVSKPSGATVRVDGELMGRTPLVSRQRLEDRRYSVQVDMPGYQSWTKRLRPDPSTGALSAIVELQEN